MGRGGWHGARESDERGAWTKLSSAATCEPRGIGGTCRLRTPVAGCRWLLGDRPGGVFPRATSRAPHTPDDAGAAAADHSGCAYPSLFWLHVFGM